MKKLLTVIMACIMMVGCLGVPAFAAEPGLDDETKKEYYAEYIKIAEEVSRETELDISVLPMDEFAEEDWRTPEEFRNFITTIANWKIEFTDVSDIQPYSSASKTKEAEVTADKHTYKLSVTGSFETVLNTTTGRQHFNKVISITSRMVGSTGSWKQTGYEAKTLDAARTYKITISGELTIGGAKFKNKLATVEFYCSSTGVVS